MSAGLYVFTSTINYSVKVEIHDLGYTTSDIVASHVDHSVQPCILYTVASYC